MKRMCAFTFAVLAAALTLGPPAALSENSAGKPVAPYAPAQDAVIRKMLSVVKISGNDLVYDLGCGDGRMVIAATRKGARGVGIDSDPQRILECRENAKKARAGDRITFLQQDPLAADFSKATVLAMYLQPDAGMRLRPRLLNQLMPGTRIVSPVASMGDWEPDMSVRAGSQGQVNCWIVPANVIGSWKFTTPANASGNTMKIVQKFQQAYGILSSPGSEAYPVRDAWVSGAEIRFNIPEQGGEKFYTGKVQGDSITGTVEWQENGKQMRSQWSAERDPSTRVALDHMNSYRQAP